MSAMKPDAFRVTLVDSEYYVDDENDAQLVDNCTNDGAEVTPLYTLATVRKWLEPTDEMVTAGVNALKADGWGLDTEELTESMRFVCRAMLAAKLRELEDGE